MSVTLLFTDIEGSTRLVQEPGNDYPAALEEHRRTLRVALAAPGGEEIDCRGDEFSAAFADPDVSGLTCTGQRVVAVLRHDQRATVGRVVAVLGGVAARLEDQVAGVRPSCR